jgi:excisionase family DNA binding protein
MENPFEIIEQRLKSIENQLTELLKMAKAPTLKEATVEIMTVEQLSDYLTIARQTIYGKCASKELPYYKSGKRLYFKKSEINNWINCGIRYTKEELLLQAENWIKKHPRKH